MHTETQTAQSGKRKRYIIPRKEFLIRFLSHQSAIVAGSAVTALGYVLFMVPFEIAAGGVSGLAIILNKYVPVSTGNLYLFMNIPLIIWGYFALGGWKFILSSAVGVVSFSLFTDTFTVLLPQVMEMYPVTQELLLNTIYGGLVFGLGMGVVYRYGGTLGGTSIPARIIQMKTGFPLSQSYLYTDVFIIVLAGFAFSWEKAMLAMLALLIGGMTSDFVLEGVSQVRIAMIVTEHPTLMTNTLMAELGRGVSTWEVTGGFSGKQRTMLYCTVRRPQVTDLKYLVSAVDSNAFLVIGTAQQAFGGTGFAALKPVQQKSMGK